MPFWYLWYHRMNHEIQRRDKFTCLFFCPFLHLTYCFRILMGTTLAGDDFNLTRNRSTVLLGNEMTDWSHILNVFIFRHVFSCFSLTEFISNNYFHVTFPQIYSILSFLAFLLLVAWFLRCLLAKSACQSVGIQTDHGRQTRVAVSFW
jgi:hypothetical protein